MSHGDLLGERIIIESKAEPTVAHDSSTNALLRRDQMHTATRPDAQGWMTDSARDPRDTDTAAPDMRGDR
jgi:hypothetical protein